MQTQDASVQFSPRKEPAFCKKSFVGATPSKTSIEMSSRVLGILLEPCLQYNSLLQNIYFTSFLYIRGIRIKVVSFLLGLGLKKPVFDF